MINGNDAATETVILCGIWKDCDSSIENIWRKYMQMAQGVGRYLVPLPCIQMGLSEPSLDRDHFTMSDNFSLGNSTPILQFHYANKAWGLTTLVDAKGLYRECSKDRLRALFLFCFDETFMKTTAECHPGVLQRMSSKMGFRWNWYSHPWTKQPAWPQKGLD